MATNNEKEQLLKYFEQFGTISQGEKEVFLKAFSTSQFMPKQKILFTGDTCQTVHYIVSGLTRYAYIDDSGNDITTTFRHEGEFITNYESFLKESPSKFFIECLEPTTTLKVDRLGLQRIYDETNIGNTIGRKIAEALYLESQERLNAFYDKSAEERFNEFMKTQGSLLNRIPQNHLASYIGIKPQSLSRIKKRLYS